MRRGIIHFHSCHSPDSFVRVASILKVAERLSLDFLILTDHDTIRGSLALAQRAADRGLRLEVPPAAEYQTDHGDLIAAFIKEEIHARTLTDFVAEVHAQNGIVLLPHPFVNHRDVESLAACADMIEVYNGRAAPADNAAALALAARVGKPAYWASDGHIVRSLSRVVVAVDGPRALRDSLIGGEVRLERCMPCPRCDTAISQAIKIIKSRDVRGGLRSAARMLRRSWRRLLRQPV